jgi:hypothetical protein
LKEFLNGLKSKANEKSDDSAKYEQAINDFDIGLQMFLGENSNAFSTRFLMCSLSSPRIRRLY